MMGPVAPVESQLTPEYLLMLGKCLKEWDYGRHACRRRCYDGDCPPRSEASHVCGTKLQCRNHKCPSPCHRYVNSCLGCLCKSPLDFVHLNSPDDFQLVNCWKVKAKG